MELFVLLILAIIFVPLIYEGLSVLFNNVISSFSFLTHFSSIQTGFFSFKGLMFFLSFMALWNYLTLIKFMNRE